MRFICFVSILLTFNSLSAQNRRYYDLLDRTENEPFNNRPATDESINIVDFDAQYYSGMLLNAINDLRESKSRSLFETDSTFMQVCNTGAKHFSASYFRTEKNRHKVIKHTELGIRHLKGKNRLFKVYTFNFNLTYLNKFTPFFYHSADETTALKLFKGKRPLTLNPDHPDYKPPVPIESIKERELTEGLIQLLKRHDGATEFNSKAYNKIGIGMRLDPYTVNRRKIPHAFIMVIIGGKQTQKATIREPVNSNNEDDNNPYTILK